MLKVAIDQFSYGAKTVLQKVAFSLTPGEHLSILGESGCGKSTLLHLIYGLLPLENGAIHWKGNKLLGPSQQLIPGEPFMKLVAQDLNVMPFTTVEENVTDYLSGPSFQKEENRVEELLTIVGLTEYRNVLVKSLSGGQKQRVALARALAKTPELLLLDEPFSHIDTFRKNRLRRQLYAYLKEEGISCITATHDAQEALAFSDRILMLRNGNVEALEVPQVLYNNLANTYQAGFFDEVTVLPKKQFPQASKRILLPHEWEVTSIETPYKVQLTQQSFRGVDFLIVGKIGEVPVYFSHPEEIVAPSVFLTIKASL